MCGIYGSTKLHASEVVRKKLDRMKFRGPDFSDFKLIDEKVILGHNRLSIIDLDVRSNQPFRYRDLWISFNGEIYNFPSIKASLQSKGYTFSTTSDTEVICAAYLEYGVKCLDFLNGMFAFVIYDTANDKLFGGRDRLGKKPFYYSLHAGCFEFCSQPAPIALGNGFSLSDESVAKFLLWTYVPEPDSIYKEIKKLPAGYGFEYRLSDNTFKEFKYWDINYDTQNTYTGSYEEAKSDLTTLLKDAVKSRMMADVPLGVFLSGGIDSSLVAAIAQSESSAKIKTFSVKFDVAAFDESRYASAVASHIGSDHTVIECNYHEVIDFMDNFHQYYDEPFADSSALPSMLLAQHTKKHVTVALSGDGGDELFLGYEMYKKLLDRAKMYEIPYFLRWLPGKAASVFPHDRVQKGGYSLGLENIEAFYHACLTGFDTSWVKFKDTSNYRFKEVLENKHLNLLERVSNFDIKRYMNEDINTKVDRASMAFSLETRAPLMDYRVAEFSRKIPTHFKYSDKGVQKKILKDILYGYVPEKMFDRPKSGFSIPLGLWFKTILKERILDIFTDSELSKIPYLNAAVFKKMLQSHFKGEWDYTSRIWEVMVLLNWMNKEKSNT